MCLNYIAKMSKVHRGQSVFCIFLEYSLHKRSLLYAGSFVIYSF